MANQRSTKKQSSSPETLSPRVLIIEDNEPTLDALVHKLTSMGIASASAKDGEEAIEKIHKTSWDVIIVDILLPKQNGFAVLEAIQHEPRCAQSAIFVFTNLSGAEYRERALKLGAHEFFEKTKISLNDIAQKIEKALTKRST